MALAQNITVIPPRRKIGTQKDAAVTKRTRVAAYCRVSTEYEEQESSYETQVAHYTSYIKGNPEWELVDVYADDGISATNTAKRDAFNRMIEDCHAGKIDMILTKSISRFARNTVDCLKYTRDLKALNIAIFFEKENINTLDAKGEVLLTIMAALAQQESESLSANVRLGIQFRNQQGKVQINHNWFLGYTKDENGKLIVEPEQAKVVQRIYREYLEGSSLLQIRRGLEADGVKNGAGHTRWHETNIKQILTNEKYIGDALLQKTYTVSILDKKRAKNDGQMPKYYVESSHEPIIDKDVFLRVQAELARRANLLSKGKRRVYSSKYALSSLVYCAHCGDTFRRIKWNNRGCRSTVWRCVSRVEKGGPDCTARTIKEGDLHLAVATAVNDILAQKADIVPILIENIRSVLEGDTEEKLKNVESSISQKQAELLEAGRDESLINEIGEEIVRLREERQDILTGAALDRELKERMDDMVTFIKEQNGTVEYEDTLVRRLVEKVTIFDEKIKVEFKSGIEMDVET